MPTSVLFWPMANQVDNLFMKNYFGFLKNYHIFPEKLQKTIYFEIKPNIDLDDLLVSREKAFIPQLQIQFLEEIALPVYR